MTFCYFSSCCAYYNGENREVSLYAGLSGVQLFNIITCINNIQLFLLLNRENNNWN